MDIVNEKGDTFYFIVKYIQANACYGLYNFNSEYEMSMEELMENNYYYVVIGNYIENPDFKLSNAIALTKKELEKYEETSLKEYMKKYCFRKKLFELGDKVVVGNDIGIIVGWNNSCNYEVYFIKDKNIYNCHPNNIKPINN